MIKIRMISTERLLIVNAIMTNKMKQYQINYSLKRRYGITLEIYQALFDSQGGKCAICEQKYARRLAVDHNHATGKVRGLLCVRCNAGLGSFLEKEERMLKAIGYVKKHE